MSFVNTITATVTSNIWEIIQTISVVVASVVVIYGITAWRRELRGKKEHDLTEEALTLVYECNDIIRGMRLHASFGGEGKSRKPEPNETPELTEQLNEVYIAIERYQKSQDKFNRLFALRYRFVALFGAEAIKPIEELRLCLNKILTAAYILIASKKRRPESDLSEDDIKQYEETEKRNESIVWASFDGSDDISQEMHKIINELELFCSRELSKK